MSLTQWLIDLEANQAETTENRRYLHAHPELSFQEKETAAFILKTLQGYGITDISTNVGNGYGMVATITGGQPGPTLALRADFDALAITEETDVAFVSKNVGVMHACGHDVHTAALLSVAKVLHHHRKSLKGNVVLIHQHAEEVLPGGAQSMVEAGALEGVDYVFGIHVASNLPKGKIGYAQSYATAAADSFEIKIQGKGGHAARPHQTVDSIMIASQIMTDLQTLVSRKVDPVDPVVLTFSGVEAGGTAYNIIADTAMIRGTIRTLDAQVRAFMKASLIRLAPHIAEIQGGTATVSYIDGYPSVKNTPAEVELLLKTMTGQFGEENVIKLPTMMGGEDFSYFLEEKPGAFFYVGGENNDIQANYPHHHPKFKIDEQSLHQSGQAFLALVAQYLL
ncbi:M20 metallopeptidase family protein [Amphibacillus cookii]|uniref:M20 metallopeptidase family protein n=1 Tax=Amphibacillus cookii TaxID=767787 RepID=UPI00195DAB3B|nr:amidohydrolase [Amphibacillus cookii]MBM7542763.1 amidohydrolase [Amphibacillus cookii]